MQNYSTVSTSRIANQIKSSYKPSTFQSNSTDYYLNHAKSLLYKYFGYKSFRPAQLEILKCFFQKTDLLAIMPTGGGKSMCYVIPCLMSNGMAIVISPLISLIRDQVIQLRQHNIPAAALDSMQTNVEKNQVIYAIKNRLVKILFLSPERLSINSTRVFLKQSGVSFVAIDEAHCVSQWGSDFRPEYKNLGKYIDSLSSNYIKKIALTATATKKVRQDIKEFLNLYIPCEIIHSPIRKNLNIKSIELLKNWHKSNVFTSCIPKKSSDCGIVYAFSRKNTEYIANYLNKHSINSCAYHAGVSNYERQKTQSLFLQGKIKIIVATQAFGMGINKKDIRFVFHYGLPANIESYVQHIGRAGRDGLSAQCLLFYKKSDFRNHMYLLEREFPSSFWLKKILEFGMQNLKFNKAITYYDLLRILPTSIKKPQDINRMIEIFISQGFYTIKSHNQSQNQNNHQTSYVHNKGYYNYNIIDLISESLKNSRNLTLLPLQKMLQANQDAVDEFITSYEIRHKLAKNTLNAMHLYATNPQKRTDILSKYFD